MHFISILGASFYEPVYYGDSSVEDEFVQRSLIRSYYDALSSEESKVTFFLTTTARRRNWDNRLYDKRDAETSKRWGEEKTVKEGQKKIGLKQQLQEEFSELRIENADICDGNSPEQIMSIFQTIFENIHEKEEVVFDITHGFRSLPMLAMAVLNYAKAMKDIVIKGIYYGAYEAAPKGEPAKRVPIFDLSVYNEILEWSFAAQQFMRYGNTGAMEELFKTLYRNQMRDTDTQELWKSVQRMSYLSKAISTNRGKGTGSGKQKRWPEQSIRCSYMALKDTDFETLEKSTNRPLTELIRKAEERYSVLDRETNYQVGMEVAKLCVEFHMPQQGFTALQETIKTFLCTKYGLDENSETDRETIVAGVLNTTVRYLLKADKEKADRESLFEYYKNENAHSRNIYNDEKNRKYLKVIEDMIMTVPYSFAQVYDQISQVRNDINHFGFRDDPISSKQFEDKLKTYVEQMMVEMENYGQETI